MNRDQISRDRQLSPWTLVALGVFVFAIAANTLNAQTTIYSEGFNSPGNGTRYQLIRDYYEVTQQNTLWTTVPNQLPGDNVIVYLEPGDNYFDGTPVPARRATFFGDNDLGDQSFGLDLTDEGFALFDAAINWATNTDGTTPLSINFVIDDDSFEEINNLDVTLVDRLRDQGHTVTVTNPDMPPEDGDDLIFMASHDDGSAVNNIAPEFKATTTPLITGFFHAAGPLGFGSERGENTNGTYELLIVDGTHPLAAGFPDGIVQVVDDAAARQRLTRVTRGQIAEDAKVVATLPGALVDVPDDYTNYEGEGYLRGGHSTWNNAPEAGQPRGWQLISPIDTTVVDNPKWLIDLAAMGDPEEGMGPYEPEVDAPDNFDYIRLLTDDNGDGTFDILAEFLAVEDFDSEFFGFLADEDGTPLQTEFQTFSFDLPSSATLDLRIDVFTNEGVERVGIDNIRIVGEGDDLPGDYNDDGVLDATDINLQSAEMKKPAAEQDLAKFDHNDDGVINVGEAGSDPSNWGDRLIWIRSLRGTSVGDSNFDGVFDSGDLVLVFGEGKYDTGDMADWSQGDWSGDMVFDSGDLVLAFQDGQYIAAAAPSVPEPTSFGLTLLGMVVLLGIAGRRTG